MLPLSRLSRAAVALTLAAALAACSAPAEVSMPITGPGTPDDDDSRVHLTVLQINDVYEITPVGGGAAGGIARVAGLLAELKEENPNTISVIAGDYLSPSAIGTARVDGERLAGRQMVAALNAMGLDVAALGNHEFDVDEETFRARMSESEFAVISGNVRATGAAFPNVDEHALLTVGPDRIRVGVVSAVLPSNPKPYVAYTDPLPALAEDAAEIGAQAEIVIGLTHLALEDDVRAAATIEELDIVMGGHEHDNLRAYRGPRMTPITKADANARTAYVHDIALDRATGEVDITSRLVPIDRSTPEDPAVAAEIDRWVQMAFDGFRAGGFEPDRVVVTLPEALDGRESTIRTRPTLLGTLIAEGFRRAAGAEAAVFNGGSVRIDDVIRPGAFSEYDAIRALPFGGEVLAVEMSGALLAQLLTQGDANAGTGGYLHVAGIATDGDVPMVGGAPIDPARTYTVATNDFLVSGRETNLDWFSVEGNDGITETGRYGDVRQALFAELKRRYE